MGRRYKPRRPRAKGDRSRSRVTAGGWLSIALPPTFRRAPLFAVGDTRSVGRQDGWLVDTLANLRKRPRRETGVMFLHAYEADTLILFAAYAKGVSTDADFDANVRAFEQLAVDAVGRPGETASIVVIAEGTNPPGARYRQRLAEIEQTIRKVNVSVVSQEKASFLVMKVFNWLAPERPGLARSIHPTYERARNWHVQKGVHAAVVFDVLFADVRRRLSSFNRGIRMSARAPLGLAYRAPESTSRAPR